VGEHFCRKLLDLARREQRSGRNLVTAWIRFGIKSKQAPARNPLVPMGAGLTRGETSLLNYAPRNFPRSSHSL